MRHRTHILVATVLALVISPAAEANLHAQAGNKTELVVEVTGLTTQIGSVQVAVFGSKEDWLSTVLEKEVIPLVAQSDLQVTFSLPAGEYAVVVTHDMNENGEHDKNIFGKPLEPFGFSNNISHPFSAPSWEEAMISLSSGSTTIEVRLEAR